MTDDMRSCLQQIYWYVVLRGANIAKFAATRKLLTMVYYALRDGHVRCLARPA
jgi:hypothetical protein